MRAPATAALPTEMPAIVPLPGDVVKNDVLLSLAEDPKGLMPVELALELDDCTSVENVGTTVLAAAPLLEGCVGTIAAGRPVAEIMAQFGSLMAVTPLWSTTTIAVCDRRARRARLAVAIRLVAGLDVLDSQVAVASKLGRPRYVFVAVMLNEVLPPAAVTGVPQ